MLLAIHAMNKWDQAVTESCDLKVKMARKLYSLSNQLMFSVFTAHAVLPFKLPIQQLPDNALSGWYHCYY